MIRSLVILQHDEVNKGAMNKSNKRYIAKNGVVVDAETAEKIGLEGGMEFEHWIAPGDAVRRVFSISPERAKAIREEYPSP